MTINNIDTKPFAQRLKLATHWCSWEKISNIFVFRTNISLNLVSSSGWPQVYIYDDVFFFFKSNVCLLGNTCVADHVWPCVLVGYYVVVCAVNAAVEIDKKAKIIMIMGIGQIWSWFSNWLLYRNVYVSKSIWTQNCYCFYVIINVEYMQ